MDNLTATTENGISGTIAVDPAQKIIEGLKNKLYEQTITLENVLLKLEKAETVLNYWEDEYSFNENPTPQAAIEWKSQIPDDKDIHGEESYKWYWNYGYIVQFISIAEDYVYESKNLLKQVVESTETKEDTGKIPNQTPISGDKGVII